MYIYKSGRFYCGDASLALPNNCKFNNEGELAGPKALSIMPMDERFAIDLNFEHRDGPLEDGLNQCARDVLEDESAPKAVPFSWGALRGWQVTYRGPERFSHEIWLEVNRDYDWGDEEPLNVLIIYVWTNETLTIDNVLADPAFRGLLDSIRVGSAQSIVKDDMGSAPICPDDGERLRQILIGDTDAKAHTRMHMHRRGYDTLYDIVSAGPSKIRCVHGVGETMYADIVHLLERNGVDTTGWWEWQEIKPSAKYRH